MRTRDINNWTIKVSNIGANGSEKYIVMFSCPFVNTNLIYTEEQVESALSTGEAMAVPHQLLEKAVQSLNIMHKAA